MYKYKWMLLILLPVMMVLYAANLFAADHYIRMDATGNNSGSDLTNAWRSLPSTLTRGDTYYIAGHGPDSLYTAYAFDDAASGTTPITIKKVTSAQSGVPGYASWMADEPAHMGGISFATSYWVFDGVVGGGPSSWSSGYGFVIEEYAEAKSCLWLAGVVGNISVLHTRMHSNRVNHVNGIKGTTGSVSNFTVSHCMIDSTFGPCFHANNWSNILIEKSYMLANKSTTYHTEGISSIGVNNDWDIRWNLWQAIEGTAVFAGVNKGESNRWHIYGNIISDCTTLLNYYWDSGSNQNAMNDCLFLNNTVVTSRDRSRGTPVVTQGSGNREYNSLYYKNTANQFTRSNFAHDYSYADENIRLDVNQSKDAEILIDDAHGWKDGGNPFTTYSANALAGNFKPVSGFFNSNPGYNTQGVLAANSVDMFGTARGGDGTWDIGAIEAGGASLSLDKTALNFGNIMVDQTVPTTYTITNTGSETLTVSSITSGNTSVVTVNPSSASLAPGGSVTVNVTFTPKATQAYSIPITMQSNAGTKSVLVTGTGVLPSPVITTSISNFDFGLVRTDQTSVKSFVISNTGSASLSVTAITSQLSVFTMDKTSGTVPAGGTMTVNVTFAPTSGILFLGNITIASNAGNKVISVSGQGEYPPAPSISLVPTTLSFGEIFVGSTSAKTFVISNSGSADLVVSLISSPNAAFTVSQSSGTIDPGGTMTVTVTFAPTAIQSYSGSISITSNAGTRTVSVSGSGKSDTAPVITLNSQTIDFGNSVVGSSIPDTVSVSNTGNAVLEITAVTTTNSTVFPVSPRFTVDEPSISINPGNSINLAIAFEPNVAQSFDGRISVYTSNAGVKQITLQGVGEPPPAAVIQVDTTDIAFGNEYVGDTTTNDFTIFNPGALDLDISSIASDSGPVFTVNPSSGVVQPGGTLDVSVTFAPAAEQAYSGTISITSSVGNKSVDLTGQGVVPLPEITVNTTHINYPDVVVGTSSSPVAFTINNTGASDLVVTGITSTDASIFAVGQSSGTIAAGDNMTVSVTFTPEANLDYTESINIASNAGAKTVSLYGTGIQPQPIISVNRSIIDFRTKFVASETEETFTISNTGLSDLNITNIASDNAAIFSVSPQNGVVAPGNTLDITVTFKPVAVRTYSGTITVESNGGSDKNVNLTGTGTQSDVPEISLSTLSMNFGGKPINTTNTKTFSIFNTGTSELVVNNIASSNPVFTVNQTSGSVPPGGSMSVTVTFSPDAEGEHLAAVSVISNAGNEHISVSGVGTEKLEPLLELSRSRIEFGSEFVYSIKREMLTISNTGTDDLVLNDIISSNPDVFFASPTSAIIRPDENFEVTVTFNPQAETEYPNDYLSYSSNAGMGVVRVSGIGTSSPSSNILLTKGEDNVSFDTIDMGAKILNTTGNETFVITNTGTSLLNITSITVSDTEVLSVIPSSGMLNPGDKLSVLVTFTPSAEMEYYESLTISSDLGDKVIQVTGEGSSNMFPILNISEPRIDFGNKVLNVEHWHSLWVKNTGTADLVINDVNLDQDVTVFSATPFGGVINPGKNFEILVTFAPDEFKYYAENLFISSNGYPNNENRQVPVTGTGSKAVVPKLVLSADSLAYGKVYTNQTSTKTVTVTNDGAFLLTIREITASSNVLSVKPDKGTVEPGFSLPVEITFSPDAEGDFAEEISFSSNAGTKVVHVTGTGLSATKAVMRLDKDTLDFGPVLLNSSRKQLVLLFNDGTADLHVQDITFSNESIVSAVDSMAIIPPKDNLKLSVDFSPIAEENYVEQVFITSDVGVDTLTVTGSGSTVYLPRILSVSIDPDTGWVKAGESVAITVVEEKGINNLIPSKALINNKLVPLVDNDDGTYGGVYTVAASDAKGRHIEAENITLATSDGTTSAPASSEGSRLNVDNKAPKVSEVTLTDGTAQIQGALTVGDKITVVVIAAENETGLIPSSATVNTKEVPLTDAGDGTYVGEYIIQENDPEGENIEATNITLTDLAGNVSEVASSSNSNLSILGTTPVDAAATDFNSDGIVDFFDFSMFILAYGSHSGDATWNETYDLNDDGTIDLNDFLIFDRYYDTAVAKVAKSAASIASLPESGTGISYTTRIDVEESMEYVSLQFDDVEKLDGFDLMLHFDSDVLVPGARSIDGLVGLSIPLVRGDMLRIASIFGDEKFEGTITIGFKYGESNSFEAVELTQGMAIEAGKVMTISSITEIPYDESVDTVIHDLTASKPSEQNVSLSWASPAGVDTVAAYRLDIWEATVEEERGNIEASQLLEVVPQAAGMMEQVRISGLHPGCPYQFVIKSLGPNGRVTGKSNTVSFETLVGFTDDDLDPENPFIIRDEDALFVADNDDSLTFAWESWKPFGAVEYEVTVRDETSVAVMEIRRVKETEVTIAGKPGKSYSVKVIPLNVEGKQLSVMLSRKILCAAASVKKPGAPVIIAVPE